jgi:hypothetical protein
MLVLAVGEKAPSFLWRQNSGIGVNGASFNIAEDGQPFIITYLQNMTEEEVEHIGGRQIESAYWSGGSFWLGLLKIGEMLQEITFDPMVHFLHYQCFSPFMFRENRLVTFVGIDSADMTIKVLRTTMYPWKFLDSLFEAFRDFYPRDDYTIVYQRLIRKFDRLPLTTLWENFMPGGYFGEKRVSA